jgi:hypothetical protein
VLVSNLIETSQLDVDFLRHRVATRSFGNAPNVGLSDANGRAHWHVSTPLHDLTGPMGRQHEEHRQPHHMADDRSNREDRLVIRLLHDHFHFFSEN